ncbi:MAG: tetratricopeptide repeat protein [Candidatus Acidiferrales bacterium]
MIRINARNIARLGIPLGGIALLLVPLVARQSSDHSLQLGIASAIAGESHTSILLAIRGLHAAPADTASITIDYPQDGSIFPPDIIPPTFIWRDVDASATAWLVAVTFADGSKPIHTISHGEPIQIGKIDPRCVSDNNKPPSLTPEQAAAHTWVPDAETWAMIKQHSVEHPATVEITGVTDTASDSPVSQGRVRLTTSKDPVGAPIFYRDVPLMPSEGAKNFIQPLAPSSLFLINWRLRFVDQPQSRLLIHDLHTCANCHSFSADGKTMGIDVDGPKNDKGLYAVVPIRANMSIRNQDMVSWNNDMSVGKSRVGFMSQVSPDGRYVLSTFAGQGQDIPSSFFVQNFKDYRFLQVFFPTRGILAVYNRATGRREPLPGADDPRYVQTDGVWSPDGKFIVFARAEAKDPYVDGQELPTHANDPNEVQIQYNLYRIPFNDGKGGQAEPILGASYNGMSNNFPKVSPDGRWIVFVKCRNGQLMRPDSQLYIVPVSGGVARRMRCNTSLMNSWHSFSPNGRWLVFSSKSRSVYTQMYLTHIDEQGQDSPPIYVENSTASNRAVNLPEFVNIEPDQMESIDVPASDLYRIIDNALALQQNGENAAALAEWKKALAIDPTDARANNGIAIALSVSGDSDQAITYLRKATQISPDFFEAYYNLGLELAKKNRVNEAIDAWLNTVRIRPNFAAGHENLGYAFYLQGKFADSLTHLRLALDADPDRVSDLNLAASLLATCPDGSVRNGKDAVALADHAQTLTHAQDPAILDTLSAAYAETGRFPQAMEVERHAIAVATQQGKTSLTATLEAHLSRYQSNKPLREPPDPVSF